MNTKPAGLMCVGLIFLAVPLSAQERPVEFGIDGGLSIVMPDEDEADNLTILGFPNGSFLSSAAVRVGFFALPRIAIEPVVSFTRVSGDGFSNTVIHLFPSVLFHFKDFGRVTLPYVRVGAGFLNQRSTWDEGDSESQTQFGLGTGVGLKIPFAETAFFRLEAGFDKWLEKGDREDWEDY